jgi:PKHD-type hydroxylase
MVRHDADRTLLFDLDAAIRALPQTPEAQAPAVQLTGVYHNLLRRWAEL